MPENSAHDRKPLASLYAALRAGDISRRHFIEGAVAQEWVMQHIVGRDGLLNVDYQDHSEENLTPAGNTLFTLTTAWSG